MKKPNITPGPWFVQTNDDHYSKNDDVFIIGNPTGSLGGDRKLAMLIDTWSDKHTIPNATAIEAVPDLIEALIMVLDDPQALDGRPRTAEVVREALMKAGCTDE